MTTLSNRYQGIDEILLRLAAVKSRRWGLNLLTALLAVVTITAGAITACSLITGYWPGQPPAALRWVLLALAGGSFVGAVAWYVVRALMWNQNEAQIARFVEQAMPELRNDLINSVLLADDSSQASEELVQQAINEAARRSRNVDVTQSISLVGLKRWGISAAVSVALLVAFAAFSGDRFSRGLMGMTPGAYLQTVNNIELLSLTPGDIKIFAGTQIDVVADIRNNEEAPLKADLIIKGADSRPMIASPGNARFTCPLGPQDQSFEYAVRIGTSYWPTDREFYRVTVVKKVRIESMNFRFEYPAYTGMAAREANVVDGAIEAPMGTRVIITARMSEAAPIAQMEVKDGATETMGMQTDGVSFRAQILVDKNGGYRLVFKDTAGRMLQQFPDPAEGTRAGDGYGETGKLRLEGYFPITAVPDEAPKAEFILPNRDVSIGPGGKLETKVKFFDKYGLTAATFWASKEGQEPKAMFQYGVKGKKEGVFDYTMNVDGFAQGDVVVYYSTVTDNRQLPGLEPQTVVSAKHKILVQDPNAFAQEKAQRFEEIRKKLLAILKMQEMQRNASEICLKQHKEVKDVAASATLIAGEQKKIREALLDLAEKQQFDPEMIPVQQMVAALSQNEAAIAIDQAGVLAKIASMDTRDSACAALIRTQNHIISVLQDLLAIMPTLANKGASADKFKPGDKLPPEVAEKLKKLDEDMKNFMDDVRKAIEASKDLVKKPTDSYTPEDQQLLKDLQSQADKWEKFMEEAMTDLSKLAQQDFSNPQMMKELISVKSDVTMAKDALQKKATEIATAWEDNGIMENAKSLTTNIEKWLPDQPDREKWKMESPTDDAQMNAETPNLPSELEDLVGDLLENEEDLFDEMNDQTSKYATSGDKGMGWDALDGPISSMNAQGVTGNQLPNNNELSGRSGEGRQGKSSGEFVEDKAVGKGGRRTPTRLTPEPFQKGEIDDRSTEPAGGATGGGKISGSGAEGLEGPLPPPLAKELDRLAGKQADLISKGKKFLDNFKQSDYSNFKLLDAITLMEKTQEDLEGHRYSNALRTKDSTLEALQQTRLAVDKKVDVTADTSAGMPKYIKDNISNAMKGKVPEEYRDVMENYYRRLGEQGAK